MQNTRNMARNALKYYNKSAGTPYPMPAMSFGDIKDERDLKIMAYLIREGRDGAYDYKGKKIYISDSLAGISSHSAKDYKRLMNIESAIAYELVHYLRDMNGATRRSSTGTDEKDGMFKVLEYGCAVFAAGAYMAGKKAKKRSGLGRLSVFREIYGEISRGAPLMAHETHNMLMHGADNIRGAVSGIINHFSIIAPAYNTRSQNLGYSDAGTNLAAVIYAANGFDTNSTCAKMLTFSHEELVQELKQAARKEVGEEIQGVSRILAKNREK